MNGGPNWIVIVIVNDRIVVNFSDFYKVYYNTQLLILDKIGIQLVTTLGAHNFELHSNENYIVIA